MNQKIKHVFWDLDGVFVDFVGGVCQLLGRCPKTTVRNWPAGEYQLENALNVSTDAITNAIGRGGLDWWAHLDPHEWQPGLRILMLEVMGNHSILTAPAFSAVEWQGKKLWAERYLPELGLHMTSQKQLLANPGTLLIDDNGANVAAFRAAGGQAILFPQPWNENHHIAAQALRVDYLRQELLQLDLLEGSDAE